MTKLSFIAFTPTTKGFKAQMEFEALLSSDVDPEIKLAQAEAAYGRAIEKMKSMVSVFQHRRECRELLLAREIWKLGDAIFDLAGQMESLSFQVDDLYFHLVRDLGVKRKWLEKVVILRRYLSSQTSIPESLNWGYFEKGTRYKAQQFIETNK